MEEGTNFKRSECAADADDLMDQKLIWRPGTPRVKRETQNMLDPHRTAGAAPILWLGRDRNVKVAVPARRACGPSAEVEGTWPAGQGRQARGRGPRIFLMMKKGRLEKDASVV